MTYQLALRAHWIVKTGNREKREVKARFEKEYSSSKAAVRCGGSPR
jgi:hypothetical protein